MHSCSFFSGARIYPIVSLNQIQKDPKYGDLSPQTHTDFHLNLGGIGKSQIRIAVVGFKEPSERVNRRELGSTKSARGPEMVDGLKMHFV